MTEATREDISQMHLLLPVTSAPVSLCKTLFTAAVLGYPVPTFIGWNKTHSEGTTSTCGEKWWGKGGMAESATV